MKVAIVHYWLVAMRGGEKVLESLCELYPQADIYTHVYVPENISATINRHTIKSTMIGRIPYAARHYKKLLPLMPLALEQVDLRGYDLIISSESGPAKGILPSGALHVCYCHSPMRYLWSMYQDYRERSGWLTKVLMPPLAHYLRMWDQASAARVDHFVANSRTVARRIESYYRRQSTVVFPPVDVDAFCPVPPEEVGDFYLVAGELVRYKRPDLAVSAFNRMGKRLVVVGGGEMLKELREMAGPTVEVLGPQSFDKLRYFYSHCRALVFPGEDDFGIVPVEAMASGRPVIAFGRGGATETVVDGKTGVLFDEQTEDAIIAAVERLASLRLSTETITAQARRFSSARFRSEMKSLLDFLMEENRQRNQGRIPAKREFDMPAMSIAREMAFGEPQRGEYRVAAESALPLPPAS